MKYRFIEAHGVRYSVRRLCALLGVSASSYYGAQHRPTSARTRRQQQLTERIRAVHRMSRETYGAPRVHAQLKAQGERCCKNTVARLMRRAGIQPKTVWRFKVTTDSRHTSALPNRLQRSFVAARPNERWVTDVTFIPTRVGWLYLAVILDLYSRAVVGWAMSERMTRVLVMDALTMALKRRDVIAPLLLHSDRGSLYGVGDYRALLQRYGIEQSMSRKANCWDNAPMESFFHTLKTELVEHCDYRTREQARASLFEYMEVFYNRQRLHSTLNYCSPLAFETMNQPLIRVSTNRG